MISKSLTNSHKHQALLAETEWALSKLLQPTVSTAVFPATIPCVVLIKLPSTNDPVTFLELFKCVAAAWECQKVECTLTPPLAIGGSPACRPAAAVTDASGVSKYQEDSPAVGQTYTRGSLELPKFGCPFTQVQQLKDSCRRWLMVERWDLEQFIARLLARMVHGSSVTGPHPWRRINLQRTLV